MLVFFSASSFLDCAKEEKHKYGSFILLAHFGLRKREET